MVAASGTSVAVETDVGKAFRFTWVNQRARRLADSSSA
jgi:hypothetical protein